MNERYEVMISMTCVKDGAVVLGTGPDIWQRADAYRTKDKAIECIKSLIDLNTDKALRDGGTVLGRSDDHFAEITSSGLVFYKKYRIELVKEFREVVVVK